MIQKDGSIEWTEIVQVVWLHPSVKTCIYIYTHKYTHKYVDIYIYRERERGGPLHFCTKIHFCRSIEVATNIATEIRQRLSKLMGHRMEFYVISRQGNQGFSTASSSNQNATKIDAIITCWPFLATYATRDDNRSALTKPESNPPFVNKAQNTHGFR